MAFRPTVIEGGGQPEPDAELLAKWAETKELGDRLIAEGKLDGFWCHLAEPGDPPDLAWGDLPVLAWTVRRAAGDLLDDLAGLL